MHITHTISIKITVKKRKMIHSSRIICSIFWLASFVEFEHSWKNFWMENVWTKNEINKRFGWDNAFIIEKLIAQLWQTLWTLRFWYCFRITCIKSRYKSYLSFGNNNSNTNTRVKVLRLLKSKKIFEFKRITEVILHPNLLLTLYCRQQRNES